MEALPIQVSSGQLPSDWTGDLLSWVFDLDSWNQGGVNTTWAADWTLNKWPYASTAWSGASYVWPNPNPLLVCKSWDVYPTEPEVHPYDEYF